MTSPSNAALVQGVPLPLVYINGLGSTVLTTTTLTGVAGQCRDVNDQWDITIPSNVTINPGAIGLNGLDTGSLGASSIYYIYAIGSSVDAGPNGYLMSLNGTYTPFMPFNYDLLRLVDVKYTDGASHFLTDYTFGTGTTRRKIWDSTITVLTAGVATTFTAVDLNAAVPVMPTANAIVELNYFYTPNAAGHTFQLRPTGSSATTVKTYSGDVAAQPNDATTNILALVSSSSHHMSIDYLVANAADALTLTVAGFEYSL